MSKLRITLIITFSILSFILTTFGFLAKLEHWDFSYSYLSFLLGLVAALVVVVLVLITPKKK